MSEENQELLRKIVLDYYNKGFKAGEKAQYNQYQYKTVEHYRQNRTRRILYPICWMVGHNIDPLMRFCKRCKIAECKLA